MPARARRLTTVAALVSVIGATAAGRAEPWLPAVVEIPAGVFDVAGGVFEWTATTDGPGPNILKGGSRDDAGCGVCRPAARHGRPVGVRHIVIGFRLVRDP